MAQCLIGSIRSRTLFIRQIFFIFPFQAKDFGSKLSPFRFKASE